MRPKKIRIAIVDDHPAVSAGLNELIAMRCPDMMVIFTAENGSEALKKLKSNKVDVMLLDMDMPVMNGEETVDAMRESYPAVKPIIYTGFYSPSMVMRFMRKNIPAVVSKTWPIDKISMAIRMVYSEGVFIEDSIYKKVQEFMNNYTGIDERDRPDLQLSMFEIQILKLMCMRTSTEDIAAKLHRAPRTIDWHRNKIWKITKIPSGNIQMLTLFALKNELLALM
jgi:two-component system competent response regulator ComA